MKQRLKEKLKILFEKYPVLVGEPVPENEVHALEEFCGYDLPEAYTSFVREFGGAIVGSYPIYGLRRAHAMAKNETSAIEMTNYFKGQKWPGIEGWFVVSSNLSGSPIGLTRSGEIWVSDHEFGVIERISSTFEQFLEEHCLKK